MFTSNMCTREAKKHVSLPSKMPLWFAPLFGMKIVSINCSSHFCVHPALFPISASPVLWEAPMLLSGWGQLIQDGTAWTKQCRAQ